MVYDIKYGYIGSKIKLGGSWDMKTFARNAFWATALTTVSAAALMMPGVASAQQADQVEASEEQPGGTEIVVVGIRGSVESAANRKRNAKQIVD